VRGILYSVLAAVAGAAMVAGGLWGLIANGGGDGGRSPIVVDFTPQVPPTSSAQECSTVAERDARFRAPHDLQFAASGRATVRCSGGTVDFTIQLDGLKPGGFYDVLLVRGRRREEIGTLLSTGPDAVTTVAAGPEVDLRRYDYLSVEESTFGLEPAAGEPPSIPFRAAL
jgi:hypothetical protein